MKRAKKGGSVLRHSPTHPSAEVAQGDEAMHQAIEEHMARWVGRPETVLHELVSDRVHVDVHLVPPSSDRPVWTLYTTGMSDLEMTAPEGAEAWRYGELMLSLPGNWSLGQEHFEDERWYWPVRWLKSLARLPHLYSTWLGWGHTVPNGDPPQPFAPGTRLCCMLVAPPWWLSEEAWSVEHEGKRVHLYTAVPITRAEMDYKLKHGAEELLELLVEAGVTDVVQPTRSSVVPSADELRH
jgi:hypothetical protein